MKIYIHESEIYDAIEVYKDWLTDEQIERMKEGECDWILSRSDGITLIFPDK